MNPTEYRFGDYRLLPAARELWQDGHMLSVTRLAFDCIAYLVEHRHRAVGRDELVAALWGRVDVAEARVSELVLRARRTVGDDGQRQNAIRTVPGFGYRWVAETEAIASPESTSASAPANEPSTDSPANIAATQPIDPSPGDPTTGATSTGAAPPLASTPRGRSLRTWALMLFLLLAAAALAYALRDRDAPPAQTKPANAAFAVLPLDVDAPSDAGWVRLGAMDLIAERLRSSGLVVPPSENVLLAVRDAQGSKASSEGDALSGKLGVGAVVRGKATRAADGWTVELHASTNGVNHRVDAKHADVIEAARQSADLLLAALGRRAPAGPHESIAVEERLQQAQAALLANELETARTILNALPEPQRNDPQVRYRLAQVDFRDGRLDEANTQLTRLLDDSAVSTDAQLRARVQTARAKVAFRRTEFAAAERDLDAAIALLEGRQAARDSADALATRGAARIGLHRFDEAATDLGRARSLFQEAGDRIGVAQAETNLGLLETERGRLERGLAHLLDATAQFESIGATERVMAVRTATFDVQLTLLRWTDALATAQQQWTMRERTNDRNLLLLIDIDRASALTGLGRYREARVLLASLQPQLAGAFAPIARRLHAAEAELAWREGRMADAVVAADRSLAAWPAEPGDLWRARLVLVRQRAWMSDPEAKPERAAAESAEKYDDPAEAAAVLRLAAAERAAHLRHAEVAEREYRSALKLAETTAAPAEVAWVATSYASRLIAQGRVDEAGALAGRVATWAEHDFDCALLQVALYRARGSREAWAAALRQAQALAGERAIPAELATPPG